MVKRIAIRLIAGLLVVVLVIYGGLLAYLYFNQRDYFFFPQGQTYTPDAVGIAAGVVSIATSDDETVTGWYAESAPGMPTILYLKGNSGSFSAEHARFTAFVGEGYGLLSIDYRGFPLSPGTISETNILADALAAFDWLAEQEDDIVVWGRSLGGAPAVWVATQRETRALLLETPFYSAVNVAAERYPYAPVAWLMLDQFRSDQWIGEVAAPIFVAHGTADTIVSVANGERLYALAPNPYDLWIEEGADHGDLWDRGIWAQAQAFFTATAQ